MHIKSLTVSGFRSYRDPVVVDELSERCNVVVGPNGSGKSNFFRAVQFVLGDADYNQLSSKDRAEILHGRESLSAFVEIVFDNEDGRLPVDSSEVSLRRTIGLKKDEFFLQKKHVTKTDVENVLESAGLSKSNPYYVVRQGKVADLVSMRDGDRLSLMKKVAGCSVYETRRAEALKALDSVSFKLEKIDENLEIVDNDLSKLQSEKEELQSFREVDKRRRALEYAHHSGELAEVDEALISVNEKATELAAVSDDVSKKLFEVEFRLEELKANESEASRKRRRAVEERDALRVQIAALTSEKTKAADVVSTNSRLKVEALNAQRLKIELENQIAAREAELVSLVSTDLRNAMRGRAALKKKVQDLELRKASLLAKRARAKRFSSAEERDSWLKTEVASLSTAAEAESASLAKVESALADARARLEQAEQAAASNDLEAEKLNAHLSETRYDLETAKTALREVSHQRREAWRACESFDAAKRDGDETLNEVRDALRGVVSYGAFVGTRAIINEEGVYGPLFSLISTMDEGFNAAVEAAAGARLAHVVVENDSVASQLLFKLHSEKAGRVTFKPLNAAKPKSPIVLPQGEEAVPLTDVVECDPKFNDVVSSVLGRILLCRDVEIATRLARIHQTDCVTVDGVLVTVRGVIKGGYVNKRKSAMRAGVKLRAAMAKAAEAKAAAAESKRELLKLDERALALSVEVEALTLELERLEAKVPNAAADPRPAFRKSVEEFEDLAVRMRFTIESHNSEIQRLNAELGSPLAEDLSSAEATEIARVSDELEAESSKLATSDPSQIKAEIAQKENNLHQVLKRRLAETRVTASSAHRVEADLKFSEDSLAAISNALEKALELEAGFKERIATGEAVDADEDDALLELEERHVALSEELMDTEALLETAISEKTSLLQTRRSLSERLKDVGSLPSSEYEPFQDLSTKQLLKKLSEVQAKLSKFDKVNRRALDKFLDFSDDKEQLTRRREQSTKDEATIRDLIAHLDERKNADVLGTFKRVSRHFRDVFKELVPNGKARLHIQTSGDDESDVDAYTGISPRVAFAKGSEDLPMRSLSGGQKAVVALALIFAIQRCDPAPFYLFDEIDQALDASYRAAVADLISRQTSQTIIVTFRPELLGPANKCFRTSMVNRVSSVAEIDSLEAQEFVRGDDDEEQVVTKPVRKFQPHEFETMEGLSKVSSSEGGESSVASSTLSGRKRTRADR